MNTLSVYRLVGPALAVILSSTIAASAFAQGRPSTRAFSCPALQDFVDSRGAVVMNTKSSNVYRRFVKSRFYCASYEITEYRFVPTRDGKCAVRICWQPLGKDRFFRRGS